MIDIEVLMHPGEAPDILAELLHRPDWHANALCRAHTGLNFFAEKGGNAKVAAARSVCQRCAVRSECIQAAEDGMEVGVWGGTTERERQALRAGQSAA